MPNKLRMSQQVPDERWSRIRTKNIKIHQIEGRSKTIEKKWVYTKTIVKFVYLQFDDFFEKFQLFYFVRIRDHLSSGTCVDISSLIGINYILVYRIICFPKSVKVAVMIIQFLKDEVTLLNRDSRLNQTYRRTVNAIYYLERNDN